MTAPYYALADVVVVRVSAPSGVVLLSDGPYYTSSTDSPAYRESCACIKSISLITTRMDGATDGDIDLLYDEDIEALFSQNLANVLCEIYQVSDPGEALTSSNSWGRFVIKSVGSSNSGGLFLRLGSYKTVLETTTLNWTDAAPYNRLYDIGDTNFRPRAYCRGAKIEVKGSYGGTVDGEIAYWISTSNVMIHAVHKYPVGGPLDTDYSFKAYNPDNSPVWSADDTTIKEGQAIGVASVGGGHYLAEIQGVAGLTVWDLLDDITTQMSVTVESATQTRLDALNAERIGLLARSDEYPSDHINALLNCYGYTWSFDNAGEMVAYQVIDPYPGAYATTTASSQLSTPYSSALYFDGDFEFRMALRWDDWDSTVYQALIDSSAANPTRMYRFIRGADGYLTLYLFPDGTWANRITYTATGFLTHADNAFGWLRVKVVADDGAGDSQCYFYESTDGNRWTQIGGIISGGQVASMYDNGKSVAVGSLINWSNNFEGKIYRAEFYDKDVLVACFNANDYESGSSFRSSRTDEEWNFTSVTITDAPDMALSADDIVSFSTSRLEAQAESFGLVYAVNDTFANLGSGEVEWEFSSLTQTWNNPDPGVNAVASTVTSAWAYSGSGSPQTIPELATEATRRGELRENIRQIWRAEIWADDVHVGQRLYFTFPRYGFDNGRTGLVHSVSRSPYTKMQTVELLI